MTKIVDSAGREAEAIVAEEDAIVTNPLTGVSQKVFAGQPIPAGLEDVVSGTAPAAPEAPEEAAEDVRATDAAKRRAEDLGVDLAEVHGTGKDGKITIGDVEDAAEE